MEYSNHGMNTLSNLYLGSESVAIAAEDDQLCISLADGRYIFFAASTGQSDRQRNTDDCRIADFTFASASAN